MEQLGPERHYPEQPSEQSPEQPAVLSASDAALAALLARLPELAELRQYLAVNPEIRDVVRRLGAKFYEVAAKNAELEAANEELAAENAELQATSERLVAKTEELAARAEELEYKALTDQLTGLGSPHALHDRRVLLEARLASGVESRRANEEPLYAVAVMHTDVIGMKQANAVLPSVGDNLLITCANHLKATFRVDNLFRRGGDEFIGLFPARDQDDLDAITERMRLAALADEGQQLRIGCYVVYPGGPGSADLLKAEDLADPKTNLEGRFPNQIPPESSL